MCSNLLEHLQIPCFCWLCKLDSLCLVPLVHTFDLHRLEWRTEVVLQMSRKRAQLLLAEIPLATILRHPESLSSNRRRCSRDPAVLLPAGAHSLTAAQLFHLTSSGRLAFSFVLCPMSPRKGPSNSFPLNWVGDLVACLRRIS